LPPRHDQGGAGRLCRLPGLTPFSKHLAGAHAFIISGKLQVRNGILNAGDYVYEPSGNPARRATTALEDTTYLFICNGCGPGDPRRCGIAGGGRKPWLPQAAVQQVVEQAVTPPPHLGRWSCRTMARAAGISPASVQRLWAASEIKPHLSRTFKLSNDKRFEEKFWDVIGLYLNPPDKALVLCCDEKSQCQALERTQPGLPLGIGHIRTKTHDYVRHGTLTLFAALNYLEGELITRLAARHRHQEWLAFLKTIDEQTPADLDIHIIADNYATHKHPAVTRWLERHARFHMHYTPTSSSWMNLVERFFRDLTEFITEKSFASTRQLADAIIAFLAARNDNPRRYVWKAKGEDILRKINAARQALAALQPASNAISETAH
jgi:transposase